MFYQWQRIGACRWGDGIDDYFPGAYWGLYRVRAYPDAHRETTFLRGECRPEDGSGPAATAAPAPQPPSTAEVWDAVPLAETRIGVNPRVRGMTGMETWLWLEGDYEARSARVVLRGYDVVAEARVSEVVWRLGDGYSTSTERVGAGEDDPAVRYTYGTKGSYTLEALVHWTGTYSFTGHGLHESGELGTVVVDASRPYDVIEVRAILVE